MQPTAWSPNTGTLLLLLSRTDVVVVVVSQGELAMSELNKSWGCRKGGYEFTKIRTAYYVCTVCMGFKSVRIICGMVLYAWYLLCTYIYIHYRNEVI